MASISILLALGIAIVLPILSAKGKGWRGLWFGLSIAALVIAVFLGSQPVRTLEQTQSIAGSQITPEQFEIMNGMDSVFLFLAVGAFLGCLIAGCVYRKPNVGNRH
jgi:hypothetical protein